MTGGFDHDREGMPGATVPYQQVFAVRFGEDAQQPFRASDPGFNSAPVLPASYRLTVSIESGLQFWDGSGAPTFSAVAGGVELNLRNKLANWNHRIGASVTPSAALVIQTVPANRQVHRHIDTTIGIGGSGETFATPGSTGGIYVFSARLGLDPGTSGQPQIASSLPLYYVYSVDASQTARTAARDYFRDIAIGTAALSLVADDGVSETDGITTDGRMSVSGVNPRASKEVSINGGSTWTPLAPSNSFVAPPGTYAAGGLRVRQTIVDHHGTRSTVGTNASAVTVLSSDTTPPTVAITSSRATLPNDETATITFTLSEPVLGFTADDVAVSGGSLTGFGGSGTTYNAIFTPGSNAVTQGTIAIAQGSFVDNGGNLNNAASLSIPILQPPKVVTISSSSSPENAVLGTLVGSFSSSPSAPADVFTYSLVSGAGSADNASFTISGSQLRAATSFDFETKNSYSIRVRSTDQGGLFSEKVFSVSVTDVNESPADISLSASSVAENAVVGTTVGTFSTADVDAGGTFAYSLVSGEGSADNASFTINGSQLKANASFNFETKNTYSIRVRSTDQGGLFAEKVFSISVANVNEAPTELTLSATIVAENSAIGTAVGTFSTADVDAVNTFTYSLVSGVDSAGNASFTISGSQLQTATSFDFETKNSYSIRVRSTDQGGLFTEKVFSVSVVNVNEAPAALLLSASSVAENAVPGTTVGAFSATDHDAGDTLTYSLVSGTGSADNASFAINGDELRTIASFSAETKNSYSIRVRSTDQGGLFSEKVFSVSVTDVNESPEDIALSASSVAENAAVGTTVGTFSTADVDAGGTFAYSLVSGEGSTDNASFTISGRQLKVNANFNFEMKNTYSIRVRSTDQGGLFTEKVFSVSISNVNNAPGDIALSTAGVPENASNGAAVGLFSTADIDTGNSFTYSLVSGTGATDNALFTINDDALQANASFDFETKNSYSIRVRSTDQGGLFTEKVFSVSVTDVNESPADIALSTSSIAENAAAGSLVGRFSTTDLDAGDTFAYSLVSGAGSADNASFTISGSQLQAANSFDFETKKSYSIRVRSTDQGGLFAEKVFVISVANVNEAPAELTLSATIVAENSAIGTAVGTFSTADVDAASTFTYALVSGAGSAGNASFTINGDGLQTAAILNYETKNSYSIRVRATDQGGLFTEKVFSVSVADMNKAPTDITLSAASVAENSAVGAAVGTFTTIDPNPGGNFTYALVSGAGSADNHRFMISGAQLQAKESFDYETLRHFTIRVESADSRGLRFSKVLQINVTNVAEPPRIANVVLPEARGYRRGERISWTFITTENVTVTGRPFLPVWVGRRMMSADYVSGSGTTQLTFSYTVSGRDNSSRVWHAGAISLRPGSRMLIADGRMPLALPGGSAFAQGVSIDSRPRSSSTRFAGLVSPSR